MSFPLYDVLIKGVPDQELTKDEKIKLITIIPTLDQKGQDNIFTLIRVHGLKTNTGGNIFEIPYDGQKIDSKVGGGGTFSNDKTTRDIKFNIDRLPHVVSQLVYKFALIHVDTMIEDDRLLRID